MTDTKRVSREPMRDICVFGGPRCSFYAARVCVCAQAEDNAASTVSADPDKARKLLPKVVAALQWALDQIGPPDSSRNEQYRSDYHAANYALFLANGRGFGITPPPGEIE